FYVGKGNSKRSRFNDHIADAKKLVENKPVTNRIKAGIIRKIIEKDLLPIFNIVFTTEDHNEALIFEEYLVSKYGRICDNT
ncbi:LEM-3-like GIY-YIG domain-containing protein, partial [Escherichia coli]|uniref:LEM-3-like GIY-YIG domain-containing protein n=1 Tax=Escherichia coli TaxID=562 RepID=UPI001964C021